MGEYCKLVNKGPEWCEVSEKRNENCNGRYGFVTLAACLACEHYHDGDKLVMIADVGSCECGDIATRFVVDTVKKTVMVEHQPYAWMEGELDHNGSRFCVPYAGCFDLDGEGYTLVIKKKGE